MPAASIPDTAEPGNGSLVVVDGPRSATCGLTIEAGPARGTGESDTPTALFIGWGIALAIVAALLAIITLRRWQRGRLHRAMADLPQGQADLEADENEAGEREPRAPARVPWLELDDAEIVEFGAEELRTTSLEDDDDLEEEEDEDIASLSEDELQDLIDELEEDHDEEVEEEPPKRQRRRVVHRERPEREQDERLIAVTVPPEESDEDEQPLPQPPSRGRRPRPGPGRSGNNVDRLKDAVKDWQTRSSDDF